MAKIVLDNESGTPAAPAAGKVVLFNDSVSLNPAFRTSAKVSTIGSIRNANTSAQAYTTTEVYITGSSLVIPGSLMQVGMRFRWRFGLTKTAGTGSQVFAIKFGTAGTVADTTRVTFTQVAAGTSATDTEIVEISAVVRSIGASGVVSGMLNMSHVLATTGFSTLGANVMSVTSSGFDTTVAGLIAGVSFNHGTAGAGNIEFATGELDG